jgi:hypothetical protein
MWRRREVISMLGPAAAGLAFMPNRASAHALDGQAGQHDSRHSEVLKNCEEACGHCEATCNTTFHHCITQAGTGKARHAAMAQMVADCATFCNLAATMIARASPLSVESCRACAEACRRCAQECGNGQADELMSTCVTSCRRCEESCRGMIRAMTGAQGNQRVSERQPR